MYGHSVALGTLNQGFGGVKGSCVAVKEQTTRMVVALTSGVPSAAAELLPVLYEELRGLAEGYMRRGGEGQTLQATALVHEAYLKLVYDTALTWNDRTHFRAIAAKAMRQVLVDCARRRMSQKRGGDWHRVTLGEAVVKTAMGPADLLAMDEALTRLEALDERQARVVEKRFFGGLTVEETAEALSVSPRTVEMEWRMAKAWLSRSLSEGSQ